MLLEIPPLLPTHNHFPLNSFNHLPTTAAPTHAQCPTVTLLYALADRYLQFVSASKPPAVLAWKFSHAVVRTKAQEWGPSLFGIAGPNIALGMDVCLLWLLYLICDDTIPFPGENYGVFLCTCVWSSEPVTINTYNKWAEDVRLNKKL